MKKIITFICLSFLSMSALAGFIETDWQTVGDGSLTLVEELDLEILDVSYSTGKHTDVADLLLNDAQYSDFRFMTSNEMKSIMLLLTDKIYLQTPESAEIAKIENFLTLIDSKDSWFFTTCDHAKGCTPLSYGLIDGNRHTISTMGLF